MKKPGQIVLVPFPYADLSNAKWRPVLLLRKASSRFDDWLACMISSQLQQGESGFDEIVLPDDPDFEPSGLKTASLIRIGRLAVIDGAMMAGNIGEIGPERLKAIRLRLAAWVAEDM